MEIVNSYFVLYVSTDASGYISVGETSVDLINQVIDGWDRLEEIKNAIKDSHPNLTNVIIINWKKFEHSM